MGFQWLSAPNPGEARKASDELYKLGTEPIMAVLLDRPEGVKTHWVEAIRLTQPCTGRGCIYCSAGLKTQESWYLSLLIWSPENKDYRKWKLYLPGGPVARLGKQVRRGTLITAEKKDGRIVVEVLKTDLERPPLPEEKCGELLPEADDIGEFLGRLWPAAKEQRETGLRRVFDDHRKNVSAQ